MQDKKSFEFSGHVLDLGRGRLRKNGVDVVLRPKSLSLLAHLVQNSGRVLGKDELIAAIWPDVMVSDDSLTQCMKDIRRALGPESDGLIRTVPRRGYIVDEARVVLLEDEPAVPFAKNDPSPPNKPSIAVLPFQNISGDLEQDYFADGLVEDILTTLSKLSDLSVIARNSSDVYKGRAVDVRQVARELGVRFVLEGSVRKAGNRIRIAAQLIDATTGIHVWADRFDRAIDDIFAVQDEITLMLATEMQVRLTEGEQARLRYTTTTNIAAWNLWIQGLSHYRSSWQGYAQACNCWERALALDPGSASLNAMLGFAHFVDARHSLTQEPRELVMTKAEAYIARALAIDPENADAHRAASGILLLKSQFAEAATAARKAIKLGPSLADVAMFGCFVLTCAGHAAEGIGHIERAIALSPNYSVTYLGVLGNAYRLAGRREEAMAAFRGYHARSPGYGLADIIMIQEQAGHLEAARETAIQLIAARPAFTITSWLKTQFRSDVDQMAADLASLRAAGVPER